MAGKINIDSGIAEQDKRELDKCRNSLEEAKNQLTAVQGRIRVGWVGQSSYQCLELLDGFVRQINEQITRADNTKEMLNTIVETYRDADSRLAGGSW